MRAYTVAVAALALQVDAKWVDNVLSHHRVLGVQRKRQGIQRQIPPESLLILASAQHLVETLGLPIARALELAHAAVAADGSAPISPVSGLTLDLATISADLNDRLADAVEGAAQKTRGRPSR